MALKIIVEGCDGAGKSTYIKKLADMYPTATVLHCTRHTPNTYEYFKSLLTDPHDYIFDRFHIGQFVYQTEDERRAHGWMTNKQLKKLEKIINKVKAQIIYIEAPVETMMYNCSIDAEDSHYTARYIQDILGKYDRFFMNSSVIPYYYFNDYNPLHAGKINYNEIPYSVAVDFDGTLTIKNGFPDITNATPNMEIINKCKQLQKCGVRIILWTNRTDKYLQDAVDFCKMYDLHFDAVNDNIPEVKKLGINPRKVWATEYWDDKAIRVITRGDK